MAKTTTKQKRAVPPPLPKRSKTKRVVARDRVVTDTCLPEMKITKRLLTGKLVGEGGMGQVFKAMDTNLNRVVARKELKPEFADNDSLIGLLIAESQITAQLDHPNIVPVYELGSEGKNKVFFTMKLIKGQTLTEILDNKPQDQRTAKDLFDELQVFIKVCDALAYAHSKGVIHKDLKPDNIMVGEFGEVYLMDWGFAHIKGEPAKTETARLKARSRKSMTVKSSEGIVTATLNYLAPEFTTGKMNAVDERTDIFCLGGILYRLLTGRPPFFGDTQQEVARQALATKVIPPEELAGVDIPARLSRISMKALAKDPKDRYQTVTEIKEDVERFLQCGWQFERKTFKQGEIIVREGDVGHDAYIVTTGKCAIYRGKGKEKVVIGELDVGDVFGELAVFASQPRAATVEAATDVSVMVLEKRHFDQDLGMSFWLGVVVKALAERFIGVSQELAALKNQRDTS